MAKYRIFTYSGDALPIAHKLQQEGCEVVVGMVQDKAAIHSPNESEVRPENTEARRRRLALFDGLVEKQSADLLIKQMRKYKHPDEYFVFFDRNYLFQFSDQIADMPFQGNFPSEADYLFERDRDDAKRLVREHYPGLQVPDIKSFNDVLTAHEFLKSTQQLWVLKGKDDSVKTFVPDVDDPNLAARQIIETLKENQPAYNSSGFILEELINPTIEVTPEKIYYDGVPLAVVLEFENKPFGSGNISIQTGCSQNLLFPTEMDDKIHGIAFPPIVDEMAKQHKGLFYWDASLLIEQRTGKIYFGEFCSNRPGYNSLFTELAQCRSVDHYFSSLVRKENPFRLGTVASSVLLLNPAIDEETGRTPEGTRIDYKSEIEKNLWLWDVRREGKRLVTVGDDWNLGVITGAGDSIDEAVDLMYKSVDGFSFAGAYYRPKSDFLSLDYTTSILNRVNYGLENKLYQLPFDVRVADIKK
jgi:hypothetical protein